MSERRTILVSSVPAMPVPDFEMIIDTPSDSTAAVEYVEGLLDLLLKPEIRPMFGWDFVDGIS